jgi:hypothetical protein
MDEPEDRDSETTIADKEPIPRYDPPDWITTEELDVELFNGIMEDSSGSAMDETGDWESEPDDFLEAEDIYASEAERRQSAFNLLIGMRPLLGELLGGPPAKKDPGSTGD